MNKWNGHFQLVNPRTIVVDHRYQRPEQPALIAHIAKAPDWARFGVLVCAKRPTVEMLYCYDGQQRRAGLLSSEKPPLEVPVVWFMVHTPQDEAELFLAVNIHRKNVTALAKFDAKVFAKDPVFLLINKTVERAGFTIDSRMEAKTISAVGALERIYNRTGEDGLFKTLAAIAAAFPDDPSACQGSFIDSINVVLSANGSIPHRKIVEGLKKTNTAEIAQLTKRLAYDLGGSKSQNRVRAIKKLAKIA